MKVLNLEEFIDIFQGDLYRGSSNCVIKEVSFSMRRLKKNTLFFDFANKEISYKSFIKKTGVVVVTERPTYFRRMNRRLTIIKVKDLAKAYMAFIEYYRSLLNIPIVGVTGTCGKTTTTEMIKTILSSKYITKSTYDGKNRLSLNLPYLLSIDEKTEAAVFELGVASPGCISYSCRYFKPEIGVLLNIGVYHLEGCKTMENYIKAKAEILEGMDNKGILIINGDDENIKKINFSNFKGKIIKIGLNAGADYQGNNIRYEGDGIVFDLIYNNKLHRVYINGYGKHNVYNALAAIAVAHNTGLTIDEAITSLATFKHVRQHLQLRIGINGSTIIDDTWNCTPPSVKGALEVLTEIANGREKIAVIGHMPRLGEEGQREYWKIGKMVAEMGVDKLIVIGEEAVGVKIKALKEGMNGKDVYFCTTGDELFNILKPLLNSDSLVLFKFPYKYRLSRVPSFVKFMKSVIHH